MATATSLFHRPTPFSSFVAYPRARSCPPHPSSVAFANRLPTSKSCGIAGASLKPLLQASKQTVCSSPAILPLVVIASRKCPLTGKKANNGYKVSFSNHRTKKLQGVNLQYKRIWWEEKKRFVKLRVSTNALKTIQKKGLDAMAKEAGIDLNKH